MHKDINIELLLTRYFSGELNSKEVQELENWKLQSVENAKLYSDYERIWRSTSDAISFDSIDINDDWDIVSAKLFNEGVEDTKVIKLDVEDDLSPRKQSIARTLLKYAAIFIPIVTLLSVAIYNFDGSENLNSSDWNSYTAQSDIQFVLPDSSKVNLTNGSVIYYHKDFNSRSQRDVKVEGMAFFDVARNESKPFVVAANDFDVTVLGTKFCVNNANRTVSVLSGKVKVHGDENEVVLIKGQKSVFNSNVLSITESSSADFYQTTKKLVFNQSSLQDIAQTIVNVFEQVDSYQYNASNSPTLLTTTFDNQSLKSIVKELEMQFGKKIIIKDKILIISD